MAFTLFQAGTTLHLMDTTGVIASVTLPTNINLTSSKKPRFAVFDKYVVMVNSPSRPITIDPDGIARVLTPRPPATLPTLTGQAGGALTGTFKVRQTFRIKDGLGNIISESDFGPLTAALAITTNYLRAANLGISPDSVSSSMLYRTTTLGSVLFPWIELDGNTQTQIQDDLSDANLSLVAAPTLGSVPDLAYVAEFRGRLWGVDKLKMDNLRWTEAGKMYAWPTANDLVVPKIGADSRGVTGLIARREALGVGRRNALRQVTGTSNSDFRVINLSENLGIESQETVVVWNDIAYWLWKDGVYEWGPEGIKCISDGSGGKGNVRSWFQTSTYFNRAEFDNAFGMIIPERKVYRLFLASAGQATIDRFVDFDLVERIWFGPHITGAWTFVSAITRPDTDDVLVPSVGGSTGFIIQEQATRTDGAATAIDFDVTTKRHSGDTPDIDKVWLQPSFFGVVQAAGSLTITPSVGELNAATGTAQTFDLTLNRQRLARFGRGKHLQLRLRENTAGQDVTLTGYELPYFEAGRR